MFLATGLYFNSRDRPIQPRMEITHFHLYCTFDRCDFLLEHNIISGHNAMSSDDNIIANSSQIYISQKYQ